MLSYAKNSVKVTAQNLAENTEIITAFFVIAAVSLFIFSNFLVGFNLPLYLFAMGFGFFVAVLFPRSGVYAIVFLTFVFERFFTLAPVYWNRTEYKIYPLDILFIGVLIGTLVDVGRLQKVKFRVVVA